VEYEDLISIATPEGVALTLTLAGLGSRAIALMLDWLVRLPILIAIALVFSGTDIGAIVFVLAEFAVFYLYDVLFEAYGGGRTPGKRWTSLRVLHVDGRAEGLGAAAVRNVIRLIDGLPLLYIPGVASIIATQRNQRLGDLAADTIVVREPRALKPPKATEAATHLPPPPGPAPAAWLPAWDVTAITSEELAALRTFLGRRQHVEPAARAELAHRLAAGLAAKIPGVGLAPPDTERFLETVAALKSARGR
jgi:uncharacterized RDD family membrane protein YckC